MRYVFTAGPEDAEERIDSFLSAQIEDCSRSYLQKLLKGSLVSVNGAPVRASYRLQVDDSVSLDLPEIRELTVEPEDIPLDILYEDEDLLVVNKPKGMVVHPAPGHREHTLVHALLYHCKGSLSGINGVQRPGIVHRIDRDTTGSLVVCKNDRAHRILAEQFAEHSITRKYRAICIGHIREDLRIEGNIGRHPVDRKRMAVVEEGRGKPAVTLVHPVEELPGLTHVECELLTGRTHQIRVHLSSVGHPVLGDPVYGPKRSPVKGIHGQLLHAMVLGFVHPTTGQYMEFTAPLPESFRLMYNTGK